MKYYEVQIDVPRDLEEKFVEWLIPHMEEMGQLPCFYQTDRLEVLDGETSHTSRRFLCRYFYKTDDDMENYLTTYAEKMRGDLPDNWSSSISFERRLGVYTKL